MNKEVCHDHSGCVKEISNLAAENNMQWDKIGRLSDRIDKLMDRLNWILGGVVVSCVLLILNLILGLVPSGAVF